MPGDHVERRMIVFALPQIALKLANHTHRLLDVFIGSHGRLEVARVRQSVCTNGPEFRKPKTLAVVLADIAARLRLSKLDAKLDAARDHRDLAGHNLETAQLGMNQQYAHLRN